MLTWQTTVAPQTAFSSSSAQFFTGPNEPGFGASVTVSRTIFTNSSANSSGTTTARSTIVKTGANTVTLGSVWQTAYGTTNSSSTAASESVTTTFSTQLATLSLTESTTREGTYTFRNTTYTTSNSFGVRMTTAASGTLSYDTTTFASVSYSSHLTTTDASSETFEEKTTTATQTTVGSNFLWATVYHADQDGGHAEVIWKLPSSAATLAATQCVIATNAAESGLSFTVLPLTQTQTTNTIKTSDTSVYSEDSRSSSFGLATTSQITATESVTALSTDDYYGIYLPQRTQSVSRHRTTTTQSSVTLTTFNAWQQTFNSNNTTTATVLATSWSSWQEKTRNPTFAKSRTFLTTTTRTTGNQNNAFSFDSSQSGTYQIPYTVSTATGTNTNTFVTTLFNTSTSTTSISWESGSTFFASTSHGITTRRNLISETEEEASRVLVAHKGVKGLSASLAGVYTISNFEGIVPFVFASHSRYISTIKPGTYEVWSTYSVPDEEVGSYALESSIGTATISGLSLSAVYSSDTSTTITRQIGPVESAQTFAATTHTRALSVSPMAASETYYETLPSGAYVRHDSNGQSTFTTSGHTNSNTLTAASANSTAYFEPISYVVPTTISAQAAVWTVTRNRTDSVV